MENAKPFKQRNIINICSYINKYCELYINNAVTSLTGENVKDFHKFFPTLLVCIFGSPTKRGWIQTETTPDQDTAIKNLLSFHGQFFKALVKLANYPEYSLDLIMDSLPADVKKVLNSGSIHLLPKVYENCSYLVTHSNMNSIDIRAAATKQSTLLPTNLGGDRKIKFTMLQFYLYYFLNVPTWQPLTPPVNTARFTGIHPVLTPSYKPSTTMNTTPNSTSTLSPYEVPGNLRPLSKSVYGSIFEEYLNQISFNDASKETLKPISNNFFIDAIIELWIRTTWISTNQTLNYEFILQLTQFLQCVVRQDLRQCPEDDKLPKSQIYNKLKDELYMLISRLAINWRKNNDYLLVATLWSIWAAPWKLGTISQTNENHEQNPIQAGWSLFILDNLLFYIFIVDIFLQRTSTFLYKGTRPVNTPTLPLVENETKAGQLLILYRIIKLINTNGLVDFLGLVEHALMKIQLGKSTLPTDPFKKLSKLCYGNESMDYKIHEKLAKVHKVLVALEGVNGVWKPKGLYAQDMSPRSDPLLKSLIAINNAIALRDSRSNITNQIDSDKNRDSLKEAYDSLYKAFKVVGNGHLNTTTPTTTPTTKSINGKPEPLQKTAKTDWIRPAIVGLNGFLTTEERIAVKQGRAVCSHDHIPTLGDRAINFVRSYEIPELVRWTVRMDIKINELCNRYTPTQIRKFLPKSLTIRFLASRVNVTYISLIAVIISYIIYKIIAY